VSAADDDPLWLPRSRAETRRLPLCATWQQV